MRHVPDDDGFKVPQAQLSDRSALRFTGGPLRLANLTGAALAALGGNGELSGTADYTLPQQWSRAIYTHPAKVDGFVYMSRLVTDGYAVVLFERDPVSPLDMTLDSHVKLPTYVDFQVVLGELNVKVTGRLGGPSYPGF
jgi:hypothetical protein